MKTKKVFMLLTCLLIASLLAGCASEPAAPTVTPAEESQTVVTTNEPVQTPDETVQISEEPVQVSEEPALEPVELYISAAASLTDVLTEIAGYYKEVAPNVTLTFSFDSSGTLQTQIEEGAPSDLFISAAQKQMNALEEKGLILPESRINLLENKVVLIVPAGSDIGIDSFADVAGNKVSMVAIGDESVPVGQYTQTIYENLGLWEQVRAKATLGENVRAVLAWVESGDVDCGIVYATDAATTEGVTMICEAPEGTCDQVIYPAAVLASTKYQDEARAFLDYLRSDTAVTAFEAAGFVMAK